MVHKWLCLSCGGLDHAVLSNTGESDLSILFPLDRYLTIHPSDIVPTAIFSSERGVLTGRVDSVIVSYILIILLSVTSQAPFGTISLYLHRRIYRAPFHSQNNQSLRHTYVLKHPGYWCYPGVESRSITERGQADA